jgi:GNAT superfamily N-acetyltransferase
MLDWCVIPYEPKIVNRSQEHPMNSHPFVPRKESTPIMHIPSSENAWADVDVRTATAADTPAIEVVLSESFAEYESRFTRAAFEATTPTEAEILERLNDGPIWVAVHDGEVVGTISAFPKGSVLCLRDLAVTPKERGKSIGKLLLVNAAKYAFRNGYSRMSLITTPFLTRAIREYEHFGFRRSQEGPNEYHGTPAYTMTKRF